MGSHTLNPAEVIRDSLSPHTGVIPGEDPGSIQPGNRELKRPMPRLHGFLLPQE